MTLEGNNKKGQEWDLQVRDYKKPAEHFGLKRNKFQAIKDRLAEIIRRKKHFKYDLFVRHYRDEEADH